MNGKLSQQSYATGVFSKNQFAHIGTSMNDDTFARIVAEDVKNKSTISQQEYLSMAQNRDRWKRALTALINNLNDQIDDINDDEAADIERYEKLGKSGIALASSATATYEERRHKIERFRFHVENKLDQVCAMSDAEEFLSRADLFEKAIRQHRLLMEECDMEVTPADEALWATLDGKWEFDDVKM